MKTKHPFHLIWIFLTTLLLLCKDVNARDVIGETQTNKSACWDVGYIDGLPSPGDCQFRCSLEENCNTWSYYHGGVYRCHLCTRTAPLGGSVSCGSSLCTTWGQRANGIDAMSILNNGIKKAKKVCKGTLSSEDALDVASDLNAIIKLYADGNFDSDQSFQNNLSNAANIAANILNAETPACNKNYTGPKHTCKYGSLVFHQLRALLLNVDNANGNRAFPQKFDKLRKKLLKDHGIFLADNRWMNKNTIQKISAFYSQVPTHMTTEGILYDAIYATQTVRDAWSCQGSFPGYLHTSNRGFNVFKTQVGQSYEQAFPGDTPNIPSAFDLQMTVTRHEVTHQFDRIISNRASFIGDSRLNDMFKMLRQASKGDDNNWLRSQVGDVYFQGAPQEIIASQIGNQYFASSSTQLRLAAKRLTKGLGWIPFTYPTVTVGDATLTQERKECASQTKNLGIFYSPQECVNAAMNDASCSYEIMYSSTYPTWGCRCCTSVDDVSCPSEDTLYRSHNLWNIYQFQNSNNAPNCRGTGIPLSWFLFNVDLFTPISSKITTMYENEVDGEVIAVEALIKRDPTTDRITSLNIPFCGVIMFEYESNGIIKTVSNNAASCNFSCKDDATFEVTVKGRSKSCDWVGLKPNSRCKLIGKDGRKASRVCLKACEMCV